MAQNDPIIDVVEAVDEEQFRRLPTGYNNLVRSLEEQDQGDQNLAVALPQENYVSPETILDISRRLKQPQMRKQSRFIDSSKFDGVGSVIGGRGESVSHRTDFIDLIYKAQTTEQGQNVVDSDFRSGIEFELGHNS